MWKTPGLFHPPRSGFSLERRNCTSGVQLRETSGSWGQRPRSAHVRSQRQRRQKAQIEKAPTTPLRKRWFFPPGPGQEGSREPSSTTGVSPESPWGAEWRGRRPEAHLQAGPDVQNRGRGIVNSSTHRPIAPGAADTPFPSLSHSFLVCKILIPAVQGEGTCVHWMRPLVKPLSLIIAFTLCSLGRQEISSQ